MRDGALRSDGDGADIAPSSSDASDPAALLRSVGCRATRPRVAVLRALIECDGPVDVGRLTQLAQQGEPGIHEATVYRTIGTLTDHGVVGHLHAGHGPSLVRLSSDRSVVAVCRDCGAIETVPTDSLERLVAGVRSATGFQLEPGHFALEGVCSRCAARGETEATEPEPRGVR